MSAHGTPWRVEMTTCFGESMGVNAEVQIVDADGKAVAFCGWLGAPTIRDIDNARAIVEAINASTKSPTFTKVTL